MARNKKLRCFFDANIICHHFKDTRRITNIDICKVCVEYNKYQAMLENKVMLIRLREVLDEIKEELNIIRTILEEQQEDYPKDYEAFGVGECSE